MSGADQVRRATSPASAQVYGYDAAGGLTSVDDATGGTCTRRGYGFDANSNRTTLTTTTGTPVAGGGCDLSGGAPTTGIRSYDAADRLVDPGYSYDPLGRTTLLPAADAAGSGELAVGYYANDLVRSLSQPVPDGAGGTVTATRSWTLDRPARPGR